MDFYWEDYLSVYMFVALAFGLFSGFPVAFVVGGIGLAFGFIGAAVDYFSLIEFYNILPRIWGGAAANLVLVAVPCFIFMGTMLERSGVAADLLQILQVLLRRVPGALALSVTVMGTIMAATTGIIGASVVMMTLLALPFLKFVGALLLVWIGVKLLAPDEEGHGDVQGSDKLLAAIKTIIVADLVMSVDNVIAIAGAAQNAGEHQFLLVVLGLLISIPIIVWGSQLVIKLMERFPMIITAGGMLLGWIAGGMLVTDPAFSNPDKWQWMLKLPQTDMIKYGASVAGALLVLLAGKIIVARRAAAAPAEQQG